MELIYPSELSPAPVAFRLRLADGWEPRPHASAAAFAVDTRSPEQFTVNLLMLTTRVRQDAGLEELVEAAQSSPQTAQFGPTVQRRIRHEIGGREALLSVLTLDRPMPLFQAQVAILVRRDNGVHDLVHGYATCPATLAKQYGAVFRAMFETLTIGV
jgi:hypothetical protein